MTSLRLVVAAATAAMVAGQFHNRTLPDARRNRTTIAAMAVGGCGAAGKLKRFAATTLCVQLGDQVAAFDVAVDAMHGMAVLGCESKAAAEGGPAMATATHTGPPA